MADFNEVRYVYVWGLPPEDSSLELSNMYAEPMNITI
jgi:hypothetical protein